MRHHRRVLVIVGACAVLLVVGVAALIFNARVATHFGYALPGAHGLPSHIVYANRRYLDSGDCVTATDLQQQGLWPLHEVMQLPTLFGPAHSVLSVGVPRDMTTMTLYVPNGACYVDYTIEGGP